LHIAHIWMRVPHIVLVPSASFCFSKLQILIQ